MSEDILPPRFPGKPIKAKKTKKKEVTEQVPPAPTSNDFVSKPTNTSEIKSIDAGDIPDEELIIEKPEDKSFAEEPDVPRKKGFLQKLFGSKKQVVPQKVESEEGKSDFKSDVSDYMEGKEEKHEEVKESEMFDEPENKETTVQDLDNIRKALGIELEQKSIQKDFEEHVEKTKNNEKQAQQVDIFQKQPDSIDDLDFASDDFEKSKNSKPQDVMNSYTKKEAIKKITTPLNSKKTSSIDEDLTKHSTEIKKSSKHATINPHKHFKNMEEEAKAEYEELVATTKDKFTNTIKKAQREKMIAQTDKKLEALYKKYKKKLDGDFAKLKTQKKSIVKEEKKNEELKKEIESKIAQKKEYENTLKNIRFEQSKLDKAKVALDKKVQRSINELEKLKLQRAEIKSQLISEKQDYQYEIKEVKRNLLEEKKKVGTAESEYKKKMVDYSSKIQRARKDLEKLRSESESILKKLNAKEKALVQREANIGKMIKEEKNIIENLTGMPLNFSPENPIDYEQPEKNVKLSSANDWRKESTYTTPETKESLEFNEFGQRIEDCRELLGEGFHEDAKLLYNELREEYKSRNFEHNLKIKLKHELKELYEEIALKILRD